MYSDLSGGELLKEAAEGIAKTWGLDLSLPGVDAGI